MIFVDFKNTGHSRGGFFKQKYSAKDENVKQTLKSMKKNMEKSDKSIN